MRTGFRNINLNQRNPARRMRLAPPRRTAMPQRPAGLPGATEPRKPADLRRPADGGDNKR
jgi:hypothetical protein